MSAAATTMPLSQFCVDEKATFQVPVEVQPLARGKSQVHWITTGHEPTTLTLAMRAAPAKVALDPDSANLRR